MRRFVRFAIVAAAICGLAQVSTGAFGQAPFTQIQLTEKHVENFISAHKEMASTAEKLPVGGSVKPDPKIQAELEAVAKKHGFRNFNEYDDIAANIALIMAGIDPATKAFTDPIVFLKKEIEEVRNDKMLPEQEKTQMLHELNEALKTAQPVKFPGNINVVMKYYDKLETLLQ